MEGIEIKEQNKPSKKLLQQEIHRHQADEQEYCCLRQSQILKQIYF